MAVQHKIHRLHGTFHQYQSGDQADLTQDEDGMLAVVSGRVQVTFPEETVVLRSSDAVSVPAHVSCQLQAMEDSVLYSYSEQGQEPAPWGV